MPKGVPNPSNNHEFRDREPVQNIVWFKTVFLMNSGSQMDLQILPYGMFFASSLCLGSHFGPRSVQRGLRSSFFDDVHRFRTTFSKICEMFRDCFHVLLMTWMLSKCLFACFFCLFYQAIFNLYLQNKATSFYVEGLYNYFSVSRRKLCHDCAQVFCSHKPCTLRAKLSARECASPRSRQPAFIVLVSGVS